MARWYSFAVARLAAHPSRDERLNVGLVVYDGDKVDVRIARNLEKIRAISAAFDVSAVRESITRLGELDRIVQIEGHQDYRDRLFALNSICPFDLALGGKFEAHSANSYEEAISDILCNLIEPEPAPNRKTVRRSRLLASLKAALRSERVLARKGEDLASHRVVSSWTLAEGLSADLVLKNGSMHVIETVDAQADDVSVRKLVSDIAVSALVLEQARMIFGSNDTISRLVYSASASNEDLAKPSLLAAEHQGAQLINWASADDRLRLIADIARLAVPLAKRASPRTSVNGSVQGRFSIN